MPSSTFPDIHTLRFKDEDVAEAGLFVTQTGASHILVNRISRVRDKDDQKFYNWYDVTNFPICQVANGTILVNTPIDGTNVTINNLLYTAKTSPTNPGDFLIGGSNTDTATNLTDVINNDTRVGGIGYVFASSFTNTVTLGSSLSEDGGDGTTLTTSNDTLLNVTPDTGFFNNGVVDVKNIQWVHRTLRMQKDFDFSKISDFFPLVNITPANPQLVVIPLRNEDAFIEYSVFFFWDSFVGTLPTDLYFGTVEVEEGKTPDFPNIPTGVTVLDQTLVARQIKGGVGGTTDPPTGSTRVYDYFVLTTS